VAAVAAAAAAAAAARVNIRPINNCHTSGVNTLCVTLHQPISPNQIENDVDKNF
jgi:hypothetical protein